LAGEGAGSITRDAARALGPEIAKPGGSAQNAPPDQISLALCGGGDQITLAGLSSADLAFDDFQFFA
jgi:hypothetical protein